MKKLIIFDLDGTLAESKSSIEKETAYLLGELLKKKKVAVISGGAYPQFESQIIANLECTAEQLRNLYLFPTCSTSFYKYHEQWDKIYSEELTADQRADIIDAFEKALKEVSFTLPEQTYGEMLEDRLSQVTFSALGQKAPSDLKKQWDPDFKKRMELKQALEKYLPEFEIRAGGATSIDVTRKGIDKAYGIEQIEKYTGVRKREMLYIGDAIFPGGNDYAVVRTGVEYILTSGPNQTKELIKEIIKKDLA